MDPVPVIVNLAFAYNPLHILAELRRLGLAATKITDAGVARIAHLKSLRSLDLEGTPVTDASVPHLRETVGPNALRSLDLARTNLSRAGVRELKKALPRCHVYGTGRRGVSSQATG